MAPKKTVKHIFFIIVSWIAFGFNSVRYFTGPLLKITSIVFLTMIDQRSLVHVRTYLKDEEQPEKSHASRPHQADYPVSF